MGQVLARITRLLAETPPPLCKAQGPDQNTAGMWQAEQGEGLRRRGPGLPLRQPGPLATSALMGSTQHSLFTTQHGAHRHAGHCSQNEGNKGEQQGINPCSPEDHVLLTTNK